MAKDIQMICISNFNSNSWQQYLNITNVLVIQMFGILASWSKKDSSVYQKNCLARCINLRYLSQAVSSKTVEYNQWF